MNQRRTKPEGQIFKELYQNGFPFDPTKPSNWYHAIFHALSERNTHASISQKNALQADLL